MEPQRGRSLEAQKRAEADTGHSKGWGSSNSGLHTMAVPGASMSEHTGTLGPGRQLALGLGAERSLKCKRAATSGGARAQWTVVLPCLTAHSQGHSVASVRPRTLDAVCPAPSGVDVTENRKRHLPSTQTPPSTSTATMAAWLQMLTELVWRARTSLARGRPWS